MANADDNVSAGTQNHSSRSNVVKKVIPKRSNKAAPKFKIPKNIDINNTVAAKIIALRHDAENKDS